MRLTLTALAGVMLGTAGLTALGTIIGIIGGLAGVVALGLLVRLQRSVGELETQVKAVLERTEEAKPPPPSGG